MSDEDTSTESSANRNQSQPKESKCQILLDHVKEHKVDVATWTTRVLTIIFTLSYILGLQANAFHKVLLANAATSALRLHQRLPTFGFTREFLARFMNEDSCHYLVYSLIFFNCQPTFLILVPIVLFAILHASSYSLKLLDLIRINSLDIIARFFIAIIEFQAINILRAAACSEILLMPLTIVFSFTGRAGFMTPVLYYNFVHMRYGSRRNPYTRDAFRYLRIIVERWAARSPPFIKNALYVGIASVSRLAPQAQPTPQAPQVPPQQ